VVHLAVAAVAAAEVAGKLVHTRSNIRFIKNLRGFNSLCILDALCRRRCSLDRNKVLKYFSQRQANGRGNQTLISNFANLNSLVSLSGGRCCARQSTQPRT
jgi:hypothetical protein